MPNASMVQIAEDVCTVLLEVNIVMRTGTMVKCATQTQASIFKWPKQDKVRTQVVEWVATGKFTTVSVVQLSPRAGESVHKFSFTPDLVFTGREVASTHTTLWTTILHCTIVSYGFNHSRILERVVLEAPIQIPLGQLL